MTKEYILEVFKDINLMYNNPNMYDTLEHMLDELISQTKEESICMYGLSEEKMYGGGAKWIREHKDVDVMDTPLWVLISLGISAIQQEEKKDEV